MRTQVIHNASVLNAVGACGLQLYNYGQTVSIPFFQGNWRPDSFYDKIEANRGLGLHTLCLLDIKVKEQSEEDLLKGNRVYQPPRYMSVRQAIEQLLEVERARGKRVCTGDTLAIGVARLGQQDQRIVAGPMQQLLDVDFGGPLHSLILPGTMHELELEFIRHFHV